MSRNSDEHKSDVYWISFVIRALKLLRNRGKTKKRSELLIPAAVKVLDCCIPCPRAYVTAGAAEGETYSEMELLCWHGDSCSAFRLTLHSNIFYFLVYTTTCLLKDFFYYATNKYYFCTRKYEMR